MKVYIVIVNYKKYQQTSNCLKLLFKFLPQKYLKNIILVDNESGKEVKLIEKAYPQVKIIKNEKNQGFSKAVNQGIKKALSDRASHTLLLNSDTIFDKDFLTPLMASKFDLVSPILKFQRKGEWIYDYGGKVNWLIGRPYHIEVQSSKCKVQSAKLNLDYVSGCCLLIKRGVFEKIGLFNENYFLYFEDVDFCLRAKKAGFNPGVESKSLVTHLLEEEKTPTRLFKLKHLLYSQLIFINHWVPVAFKPLAYLYYCWLLMKVKND